MREDADAPWESVPKITEFVPVRLADGTVRGSWPSNLSRTDHEGNWRPSPRPISIEELYAMVLIELEEPTDSYFVVQWLMELWSDTPRPYRED